LFNVFFPKNERETETVDPLVSIFHITENKEPELSSMEIKEVKRKILFVIYFNSSLKPCPFILVPVSSF